MDPLATLNQAGAPGFNLTLTSLTLSAPSLSEAASCRCGTSMGGLQPTAVPGPAGPGAADPMTMSLLRTEMMMNQTLLQLMQLMVQLMANRGAQGANGADSAGSQSGGTSSGSNSSSGVDTANSSNGAGSSGATAGLPAPTATGSKLARIALAEATDGDSQGGWCLRDVRQDLEKIGISVHGQGAWEAADQLARNPKVKEVKVSQADLPKLPAGAIVVWNRGNGHQWGHISVATGDGREASDLMHNQTTHYGTSYRVFMPQ